MKKIFLFSICTLLLVDNVFATCGPSTLGFDGTQKPQHDEFLYIDDTQYKLTESGYENSNRQTSGSGYGYECDTTRSAGCDKGDEVTLPAGHVFKGKPVPQSVKYICRSGYGFNDHWEAQKGTEDACDTKFGKIPVGKQLEGKTTVDCSGISKTEENVNLVKSWAVLCRPGRTVVCKPTECVKDYEVNIKTGKCDFIGCPDCGKTMCNFDGKKVEFGYCEQNKDCQRATLAGTKTGEVCKRCCGKNSKGQMENKYLITKCPSGKNGIGFKDAEKTFTPKDIYNGSYRVCEEKKNSCKESRKTEEGKACCDFSVKKIADWDSETQRCICADKNASFEKVNGKWQCVPKAGTCDSLKGNPEAYACCTAGYKWENGNCEGCPDGQRWYWSATQDKGICIDIDNGPVVEPTPTTCTETDCKITINQTIRCFNNGNYFNSTENYSVCKEDLDALRLDCNGLKTRVNACQNTDCIRGLLARIDAFDELIAKVCKPSGAPTPVVVPDNSAKIAAAKQTVSSFFGSAESNKSVWKDSEGNFNTARLASDLTAGVVLGTVGGVVSGVVIKKKQVEKGFDALHCAVGGQTVADWGDTFNVGLRR